MKVVFPGSFDPITNGHTDIILRAVDIFGSIEVLILNNVNKKSFFDAKERKEMIEQIFCNNSNVKVVVYNGLLYEYVEKNNVDLIVRGIRNTIDFEYEKNLAKVNYDLSSGVETIFLPSNNDYISSSMIRELYSFGGNYEKYVNDVVKKMFDKK